VDGFFVAVVLIAIPIVIGTIVKSVNTHQRYMKVLQLKAEAHQRLLERFGNDPALLEFLKSDPQKLFDVNVPMEIAKQPPLPYQRMLTAVQLGLVVLSFGVGLLAIKGYFSPYRQEPLLVFGAAGVSLGIGGILAAGAALAAARFWQNGDADARTR
jgi:uncharacterized membrane protein YcjF (UPF0283 family)